jgi:hypothetical protein
MDYYTSISCPCNTIMSHMATRRKAKETPPAASGSTLPSGNNNEGLKDVPEEPPDPSQEPRQPAAPPAATFTLSPFPLLSPTPPRNTPEWAQNALEYASYLWSTIDKNIRPIKNSPESEESIKVLSDIRQLMECTNQTIGSALSGTAVEKQPDLPRTDDPVLKAMKDLSERMRTQEEAILQLKKAAAPSNRNPPPNPSPVLTPSPFPTPYLPPPPNAQTPVPKPKPTYSQTAAKPNPTSNLTKTPSLPHQKPLTPPPPPPTIQYVVRFQGNPSPPEN